MAYRMPPGGAKILLVYDNLRNLRTIQNCLLSAGHSNILSAFTHNAALQMMENENPDLVILDWNLADESKLEAFKKIQSKGFGQPMYFIITLIERIDPAILHKVLGKSSVDYIRMPFSHEDFLDMVHASLEVRSGIGEMPSSLAPVSGYENLEDESNVPTSSSKKQRFNHPVIKEPEIEYLKRTGRLRFLDKIYNDLKINNKYLQNELLFLTMKQSHLNDFMGDLKRILTSLSFILPVDNNDCYKEIMNAMQLISKYLKNGYWDEFKLRFAEVHPSFYDNLMLQYPTLTESDLRLCALIKMKLSSKEIAEVISHTVSSVKVARNRLRSKLKGIGRDESLMHFLVKY